jgi:hypothetical protein
MQISSDFLVRHLGELRYQLGVHPSAAMTKETAECLLRVELQLERLPYSLSAAAEALQSLVAAQVSIEAVHRPRLERSPSIQMLSADERNSLSFHLDAFLDAARRAQNAVIPYLRYAFATSLPKSFTQLASGLRTDKYHLPSEIKDLLLTYWDDHGLDLKNYRDLAQHYVVVASEARVFLGADGRFGIFLAIPNNPEVTSASELKYTDPEVHVFPWMLRQFEELLIFVNALTYALLDPARPLNRMLFGNGKPGIGFRTQGTIVVGEADFAQIIDDFVQHIRQAHPLPKPER